MDWGELHRACLSANRHRRPGRLSPGFCFSTLAPATRNLNCTSAPRMCHIEEVFASMRFFAPTLSAGWEYNQSAVPFVNPTKAPRRWRPSTKYSFN
jgi:hypothetical protein